MTSITHFHGIAPLAWALRHRWGAGALGIGLTRRVGYFASAGRARQRCRVDCDAWPDCFDTRGHGEGDPISHLESEPYVDGAFVPLGGFSYFLCRQPLGLGCRPLDIDGGSFNRWSNRMVPNVAA